MKKKGKKDRIFYGVHVTDIVLHKNDKETFVIDFYVPNWEKFLDSAFKCMAISKVEIREYLNREMFRKKEWLIP